MANFRCSFNSCKASFQTEGELRQHKLTKPDHAYCLICDHDFVDATSLRMHVVQRHPQPQELHCPGCGEVFHRFAGLIGHWEGNCCGNPNYSATKLHERREEQLTFATNLHFQSTDVGCLQSSALAHGSTWHGLKATFTKRDGDANPSFWKPGDFPLPSTTQHRCDDSKTADRQREPITEDAAFDDSPWAGFELPEAHKSPVRGERLLETMGCSQQGLEREGSGLSTHHPDHPEFNAKRYWDEGLRWYKCPHGCTGK